MRNIKFEYIWSNGSTNVKEKYTLEQVEAGIASVKLNRVKAPIIARRQYTGLEDKNGVEIYEGDICLVEGLGNCEVDICKLYGAVFKQDGCDYPVIDSIAEDDSFEVIGNIYENPDLLESL